MLAPLHWFSEDKVAHLFAGTAEHLMAEQAARGFKVEDQAGRRVPSGRSGASCTAIVGSGFRKIISLASVMCLMSLIQ
jgi:hypothetical protein